MTDVGVLQGTDRSLQETFDVALLDLDGVIYRGGEAIAHAADALAVAAKAGMRLAFVTNNALRPPESVAQRLTDFGVPASVDDVVTSAQAAARMLSERLEVGARVLVTGGEGLRRAIEDQGFVPVDGADDDPAAVVQGYDPTLTYERLCEAALAIRADRLWVASNLDSTVPAERGLLPGAGSFVALLRNATDREPLVAGKPERTLHEESVRRTAAQRPLVVGDRLDTDIEGAVRAGTPSLLVLTGVVEARDAMRAAAGTRPSYLGADLRALHQPAPDVVVDGRQATCGGWCCEAVDGTLRWSRTDGPGSEDGLDGLRAACALAWSSADAGEQIRDASGERPPGCSELF
ncbi:MAG TPA: HAD-IIA family hydrolase [Frankiaceae bacterium]|nr:HAD-IIA family hydrolase [Frankiaceae bacterium]